MITISRVKYPHPGQRPSFEQVVQAAYRAVDETIMLEPCIRQVRAAYDRIWTDGPGCIIARVKIRPVVFARQLVAHYMMTEHGGSKAIGKLLGGKDHTTVLHGRDTINDIISLKYDTIEKDAYRLFRQYLNKV
jgi:chromosomal replication initiation ATPase DnaA